MFPPGFEPGTFRVWGERDNHYTTETTDKRFSSPYITELAACSAQVCSCLWSDVYGCRALNKTQLLSYPQFLNKFREWKAKATSSRFFFLFSFFVCIEDIRSNYHTIALISHSSKVMLKILQARLQQYMSRELPDVQAGFRKGRGARDQIANIHWSSKKQKSFRKTSTSALQTMPKPLTVWITTNCRKFFKRWKYQTSWPAFWETCMQVRRQQLELAWNNRLVPNRERYTSRLRIVTLLI